MIEERYDPEIAAKCAQRDTRRPGIPHHHFRCDFVKGEWPATKRCTKGQGHLDEHTYEDS